MHQPQAITTTARALRERGLLRRIHENGDLCARGQLAEEMLPLARALAGRYANRGEPLDDLLQVACIGIMKAIDLFDISREVRFSSYATPTVLGELKRHFRDNTWAMHVPRGLQELQLKVVKARDKLTHELGRSPSIQEIATAVEAPLEEVLATIQSFSARRTRSLDEPTGEDVTLADSLGMVDPEIERAEMRALLDGAFDVLSDCDQEVLRLRFEHDLTQTEIADRIGVSPDAGLAPDPPVARAHATKHRKLARAGGEHGRVPDLRGPACGAHQAAIPRLVSARLATVGTSGCVPQALSRRSQSPLVAITRAPVVVT